MAKANGDTSHSPLAQQNATPSLPPPSDNSPRSDLVPPSGGNIPSSPAPADNKQAITVPPISPSQSSGISRSKGVSKPLPDVPPMQALQLAGGDTSLGFPGAEEPGEMTQSHTHTDSSREGNTTKSHTHNSTGSSAVPQAGTRPATWTDTRILTTSPLSLPLSLPVVHIDPSVGQREEDMLPGPSILSKSTWASELPRSPDEQGDIDPSRKISQDLSQPVVANIARPVSMMKSPAEHVNSSPQIAKRNTSNDSTSSPSLYPSQEGVGTPPCHSQEGTMDGTDPPRKKKRGLLSIICPCFG